MKSPRTRLTYRKRGHTEAMGIGPILQPMHTPGFWETICAALTKGKTI